MFNEIVKIVIRSAVQVIVTTLVKDALNGRYKRILRVQHSKKFKY
jgi:hypothetical protein